MKGGDVTRSCQTCDGSGYLALFTTRERCRECELADKFNADYEAFSEMMRDRHLVRSCGLIHQVVLWSNGMVMTMDEAGNQMPEYQGRAAVLALKIVSDAPESAEFYRGTWGHGTGHELEQISGLAFLAAAAGLLSGERTGEPSRQ